MKHNDHRVRLTKMLIRRAFTDLLSKKPIQNISIKELCENAGINRTTFYSHYTDVYDLRDKIELEMFEDLKEALSPLLSTDSATISPVKITSEIFKCLKENADVCTMTLGEYGDKAFALKLLSLGHEKCLESYSKYFTHATPKQIEYYYAFVSAGCIGLLQKWLDDGLQCSAEKIAQVAESIMLSGIEYLK